MRDKIGKYRLSEARGIFFEPALYDGSIIDISARASRQGLEEGVFWCSHYERRLLYRDTGRIFFDQRVECFFVRTDVLGDEEVFAEDGETGSVFWDCDEERLRERIIPESKCECFFADDNPLPEIVFGDDFFDERPIKILWIEFFLHIPEVHPLANRDQNSSNYESMNELVWHHPGSHISSLKKG